MRTLGDPWGQAVEEGPRNRAVEEGPWDRAMEELELFGFAPPAGAGLVPRDADDRRPDHD
jgi:hypothetical protein